ncbi:Uncharacterised protein [Slackia heliotrinireducens]|uniref:Uncharacterized protein n=1 Tax=Slackia heliotrinireducens (strain ATCC 29202 / DSM 20476 / NCTC 11029 / RHS 1) TaxID=471855 RepID=C7N834_SLAHD|nr:hypothetical protein [Slackia heliotrinireducens]ACV23069.1 hypothetical protein Shel_20570 [Slackia heliotrinireducens DSM 20476]VEH02031.1 Uncharacterised protein [Slackia heliotrinireducens]
MGRENAFDMFDEAEEGAAAFQASREETVRKAMADATVDSVTAQPPSTPVSGTDGPAEGDGGTATEGASAETAKPRRGRRRGPARETHAITVPAGLWQEWVEMAERHDTNVSFMIEDVMRRKGRKLYE